MLYLHIPFCEMLCPYCSFNRFIYQEKIARDYFQYLRKEMLIAARMGYQFDTLYVGGGTPTVLLDELADTIDLGRELFKVGEVSCETNPNHLTDKVVHMLSGRVQRLSVGVQSFNDDLLKQMGRFQKFGSGKDAQQRIQEFSGHFSTFNVDMIFNFPRQTEKMIREDIEMIAETGANQVSFYPLMTAPSVASSLAASVGQVDYHREAAFYQIIAQNMGHNFNPSTAWTYSRKGGGMIDEYIAEQGDYVGLGSGSFSYLNGALYVNTFSPQNYAKRIQSGRMSVYGMRRYNLHDQMRYRFMMDLFGLRLDKGLFQRTFGLPIELGLPLEMAFMYGAGAFDRTSNSRWLIPSLAGRYLVLVMMREFFSGVDKVREVARQGLSFEERQQLITAVSKVT